MVPKQATGANGVLIPKQAGFECHNITRTELTNNGFPAVLPGLR